MFIFSRNNNRSPFLRQLEDRRGENVKPDQPEAEKTEDGLRESDSASENTECQTVSIGDELLCLLRVKAASQYNVQWFLFRNTQMFKMFKDMFGPSEFSWGALPPFVRARVT